MAVHILIKLLIGLISTKPIYKYLEGKKLMIKFLWLMNLSELL